MLKKEICQKCCNNSFLFGWTEFDESWWKEGKVYCPDDWVEGGEKTLRKITDKPPNKCPYLLEQILSNQGK